jgi:hypothetical protein
MATGDSLRIRLQKIAFACLELLVLFLALCQTLVNFGREYARYWLTVMFAFPLMVLSSGPISTLWVITYLISRKWVSKAVVKSVKSWELPFAHNSQGQLPWSTRIQDHASGIFTYAFTFGHGSWLKLTALMVALYVFVPVPSPALAYLADDTEGTAGLPFSRSSTLLLWLIL